ncbi:MAG: LytTR family DNA-binding domain-containing protein, partial [Pseudomonadota bacterium]
LDHLPGCADLFTPCDDIGKRDGANAMEKVVNDSMVADALAEARDLARRPGFWASLSGVSLLIGFIGPFGTFDDLPLLSRLAYWLIVCPATFWVGFLPAALGFAAAERAGVGALPALILSALASSVPVTLLLAGMHHLVFSQPFWREVLTLFPYIAIVSVAVIGVFDQLVAGRAAPPSSPATTPSWLEHLPDHLGRDLIVLQAQDHYVMAETPRGQALIRACLRDAEAALGPYGLRVHRSWWVARDAIDAYTYRGGAPVITLRTGREVPVGRAYRKRVRAALAAS